MQVSNGTAQGSEYRVGTSSGGANRLMNSDTQGVEPKECTGGLLEPGECKSCSISETVYVEFWVRGRMVASVSFPKDPGQVTLIEKEDGYSIVVTNLNSVAA